MSVEWERTSGRLLIDKPRQVRCLHIERDDDGNWNGVGHARIDGGFIRTDPIALGCDDEGLPALSRWTPRLDQPIPPGRYRLFAPERGSVSNVFAIADGDSETESGSDELATPMPPTIDARDLIEAQDLPDLVGLQRTHAVEWAEESGFTTLLNADEPAPAIFTVDRVQISADENGIVIQARAG